MEATVDLQWSGERIGEELETRLELAIARWVGTRYVEGAQVPRGGVDCWRFVSAVADDMRQRTWTRLPRFIADASMHAPELARGALRWAMREHDCRQMPSSAVRPGDVIVVGPRGGGPGHAMIAGPDGFVWHVVQNQGLCRTGLSTLGMDFHGILRVRDGIWPQHQSDSSSL